MAEIRRVGDLEIDQDLDFQRRYWVVQRVSWVLIALLMIAALAGVFGSGPLSRASTGGPADPIRLEYQRFGRLESPQEITVRLSSAATPGTEARVWLSRDYLESMQVESVVPEPSSVQAGTDRLVFVFPLAQPNADTSFTFHLKAQRFGPLAGRVGLPGGAPLEIHQFIYP